MTTGQTAPGTNESLRAVRRHVVRLRAAVACAALTFFLDLLVLPARPADLFLRIAVSSLSLTGLAITGWAWLSLQAATRSAWASYAGLSVRTPLARGWQRAVAPPWSAPGDAVAPARTLALFWLAYVPALEVSSREIAGRYGPQAGAHAARWRKAAFVSRGGTCAVTAFWLAYANFYAGLASWYRFGTFFVLVLCAEGALLASAIVARRELGLQLRSMIDVTAVSSLTSENQPWRPSEYAAWCRAHDIEPYPFGRPDLRDSEPASVSYSPGW